MNNLLLRRILVSTVLSSVTCLACLNQSFDNTVLALSDVDQRNTVTPQIDSIADLQDKVNVTPNQESTDTEIVHGVPLDVNLFDASNEHVQNMVRYYRSKSYNSWQDILSFAHTFIDHYLKDKSLLLRLHFKYDEKYNRLNFQDEAKDMMPPQVLYEINHPRDFELFVSRKPSSYSALENTDYTEKKITTTAQLTRDSKNIIFALQNTESPADSNSDSAESASDEDQDMESQDESYDTGEAESDTTAEDAMHAEAESDTVDSDIEKNTDTGEAVIDNAQANSNSDSAEYLFDEEELMLQDDSIDPVITNHLSVNNETPNAAYDNFISGQKNILTGLTQYVYMNAHHDTTFHDVQGEMCNQELKNTLDTHDDINTYNLACASNVQVVSFEDIEDQEHMDVILNRPGYADVNSNAELSDQSSTTFTTNNDNYYLEHYRPDYYLKFVGLYNEKIAKNLDDILWLGDQIIKIKIKDINLNLLDRARRFDSARINSNYVLQEISAKNQFNFQDFTLLKKGKSMLVNQDVYHTFQGFPEGVFDNLNQAIFSMANNFFKFLHTNILSIKYTILYKWHTWDNNKKYITNQDKLIKNFKIALDRARNDFGLQIDNSQYLMDRVLVNYHDELIGKHKNSISNPKKYATNFTELVSYLLDEIPQARVRSSRFFMEWLFLFKGIVGTSEKSLISWLNNVYKSRFLDLDKIQAQYRNNDCKIRLLNVQNDVAWECIGTVSSDKDQGSDQTPNKEDKDQGSDQTPNKEDKDQGSDQTPNKEDAQKSLVRSLKRLAHSGPWNELCKLDSAKSIQDKGELKTYLRCIDKTFIKSGLIIPDNVTQVFSTRWRYGHTILGLHAKILENYGISVKYEISNIGPFYELLSAGLELLEPLPKNLQNVSINSIQGDDASMHTEETESDTVDSDIEKNTDTGEAEYDATAEDAMHAEAEFDTEETESDATAEDAMHAEAEFDTEETESDTVDSDIEKNTDTGEAESDATAEDAMHAEAESDTEETESDTVDSDIEKNTDTGEAESDATAEDTMHAEAESDTEETESDTVDSDIEKNTDTGEAESDATAEDTMHAEAESDTEETESDTVDSDIEKNTDTGEAESDATAEDTMHAEAESDTEETESDTVDSDIEKNTDTGEAESDATAEDAMHAEAEFDTEETESDTVDSDLALNQEQFTGLNQRDLQSMHSKSPLQFGYNMLHFQEIADLSSNLIMHNNGLSNTLNQQQYMHHDNSFIKFNVFSASVFNAVVSSTLNTRSIFKHTGMRAQINNNIQLTTNMYLRDRHNKDLSRDMSLSIGGKYNFANQWSFGALLAYNNVIDYKSDRIIDSMYTGYLHTAYTIPEFFWGQQIDVGTHSIIDNTGLAIGGNIKILGLSSSLIENLVLSLSALGGYDFRNDNSYSGLRVTLHNNIADTVQTTLQGSVYKFNDSYLYSIGINFSINI